MQGLCAVHVGAVLFMLFSFGSLSFLDGSWQAAGYSATVNSFRHSLRLHPRPSCSSLCGTKHCFRLWAEGPSARAASRCIAGSEVQLEFCGFRCANVFNCNCPGVIRPCKATWMVVFLLVLWECRFIWYGPTSNPPASTDTFPVSCCRLPRPDGQLQSNIFIRVTSHSTKYARQARPCAQH